MRVREDYRTLTGTEKAAILMLSVGEDHASRLFSLMDDEEIKELSQTMSNLGTVHSSVIERLFAEFAGRIPSAAPVVGNADSPEGLLETVLGDDSGKLAIADETALAGSLQNEHPRTVAVALSKIKPDSAARILGQLPEAFATDVVMRMLRRAPGQKHADDGADRPVENRFIAVVEERTRAAANRVTAMTFTFEDLGRLGPGSVQTLLRNLDKSKLAIALKGASEPLRELFFANMSKRAGQQLREQILALGPLKLRDVEEAQMYMVAKAKELEAKDELVIAGQSGGDDELIY